MRRSLPPRGITLFEILIVTAMIGFVSTAIYTFFRHYSSSYVKIDDKLESITEGWQILRMLKDDLMTCDCPNGDTALWFETIKNSGEQGYEITKRCDDQMGSVLYHFDSKKGDITREERLPGKSPRTNSLLKNRCNVFTLTVVTDPAEVPPGKKPQMISFRVHLELGNVARMKETSSPLIIDTNIFPVFLNQRLNHRYIHQGLLN